MRHLLSENMICCLENLLSNLIQGGHENLQLRDKGSLKTLVTKWRGYEKFSLSIEISSDNPALIVTDP